MCIRDRTQLMHHTLFWLFGKEQINVNSVSSINKQAEPARRHAGLISIRRNQQIGMVQAVYAAVSYTHLRHCDCSQRLLWCYSLLTAVDHYKSNFTVKVDLHYFVGHFITGNTVCWIGGGFNNKINMILQAADHAFYLSLIHI